MKPGGGRNVASLSPAATEILIGVGAADRLVAVSNWESSTQVSHLPRVGDYRSTDWETIARLRPDVMVIQVAADRVPPGLKDRAKELNVDLVNIKIDRLEDVFAAMQQLGAVAGEAEKGRDAVRTLREQLDAVRAACADKPPVRTLVVRDENGKLAIGGDNFLDDVLRIVNATNVAAVMGKAYPTVDPEQIVSFRPDVVIVLLPGAKPESLAASERFWRTLTDVPAVRDGRVHTVVDGHALVPGPHLADVARALAERIHGAAATGPTSQPSLSGKN